MTLFDTTWKRMSRACKHGNHKGCKWRPCKCKCHHVPHYGGVKK